MLFRMENGKGMIPKSENRGMSGKVRPIPAKNHPPMPEVQTVKKAESEMTNAGDSGRSSQGVGNDHVRRMREISGSEIR